MEKRWHDSLVKILKARLLFYQLKLIKESSSFIIIDAGIEDIIIPKKQISTATIIYFVKNKEVVGKFISSSEWKNNVFKEFMKFYWQRQKENLNTYDNI
jgi:hypothetical protein